MLIKLHKFFLLLVILFALTTNSIASQKVHEKVYTDLNSIKTGDLALSSDITNDYYSSVIKVIQSMFLELSDKEGAPFITQYDFSYGQYDSKMKNLVSKFQAEFMNLKTSVWYSGIFGKGTYQNLLRELRKQEKNTEPKYYVDLVFPPPSVRKDDNKSTTESAQVSINSQIESVAQSTPVVSSGNVLRKKVLISELVTKNVVKKTSVELGKRPEVKKEIPKVSKVKREVKVSHIDQLKKDVASFSASGYIDQKYSGLLYSKRERRMIKTDQDDVDPHSEVFVALGESKIFDSKTAIKKIALGDTKIADTLIVNSKQILVNAKSLGITTMTIWDRIGSKEIYYISVGKQSDAIQTKVFKLNHIKLRGQNLSGQDVNSPIMTREDIYKMLVHLLSSVIDERNFSIYIEQNLVLVQGSTAEINKVARLIRKIDTPIDQIYITAKIAEVDKDSSFDFTNVAEGATSKVKGSFDKTLGGTISYSLGSEYNLAFAQKLTALTTKGKAKILASPSMIVQSGEIAKMTVAESIPFITWKDGESSISYMEAGVLLSVFAQSNYDETLTVHVGAEVSNLTADLYQGYPSIQKRSAATALTVRDNDTIVLAGLVQQSKSDIDSKLPVVGDIPLIGDIFSTKVSKSKEVELIISITLHTIKKQ